MIDCAEIPAQYNDNVYNVLLKSVKGEYCDPVGSKVKLALC